MRVPFVLLMISLAGVGVALISPPLWDVLLLAVPAAIAAAVLLLTAILRYERPGTQEKQWIVVDGSNVMHWKDGTPQIQTLHEVLDDLGRRGFSTGIVFDANAGYLLAGKYLHHGAMGRMLGVPEDRVMVVPKGMPADETAIATARDLGARIVTNDRYRDWIGQYPEVSAPGFLVRGGYRGGTLWLDLEVPGERAVTRQLPEAR
jgi:hypothetical protein